jgi:hypothetical protein
LSNRSQQLFPHDPQHRRPGDHIAHIISFRIVLKNLHGFTRCALYIFHLTLVPNFAFIQQTFEATLKEVVRAKRLSASKMNKLTEVALKSMEVRSPHVFGGVTSALLNVAHGRHIYLCRLILSSFPFSIVLINRYGLRLKCLVYMFLMLFLAPLGVKSTNKVSLATSTLRKATPPPSCSK